MARDEHNAAMDDLVTSFKHIRFLGAEGIGMSALIRILEGQIKAGVKEPSLKISRSDLAYEKNRPVSSKLCFEETGRLKKVATAPLGASCPNDNSDFRNKSNDALSDDIDLVVRSTAIAESDPDYVELKSRGLEIWHRSDMLNFLTEGYKQVVVSGTHGKTSCSAILSHILVEAGLEPCFAVGGILKNYDSNGQFGKGEYFVLEGDESDKSFTKTSPYLALVTNIEPDHLENYPGGIKEIKQCFFDFLDRAEIRIICTDNSILQEYLDRHVAKASRDDKPLITYSLKELKNYDLDFILKGKYNQLNALGCIKAAEALGVKKEIAEKALKSFTGIKRRFELINKNYCHPEPLRRSAPLDRLRDGPNTKSLPKTNPLDPSASPQDDTCKVYDDYAHHPTEVKALLEATLSLNPKKLLFVYQPHHPERTQQFWNEFIEVFKNFPQEHKCLIADIYVARSKHIDGVNSERLVEEINNPAVKYLAPLTHSKTSQGNIKDMTAALKPSIDAELEGCDYLFIVGAGDISKIVPAFKT